MRLSWCGDRAISRSAGIGNVLIEEIDRLEKFFVTREANGGEPETQTQRLYHCLEGPLPRTTNPRRGDTPEGGICVPASRNKAKPLLALLDESGEYGGI